MLLDDLLTLGDGAETEEEYFTSMQRVINSGMWSMPGSFGRAMMDAIRSGRCMLGTASARDCCGNYIPSRSQVKPGAPGSRKYVVARMGKEWAKMLEKA